MSSTPNSATAFAPATVGNVIVGFDVLGLCLESPGDLITVERTSDPGVRVVSITGIPEPLPISAEENTAGQALLTLCGLRSLSHGFAIRIQKGIPLGSGMGGSAASAVGAGRIPPLCGDGRSGGQRGAPWGQRGALFSGGACFGQRRSPSANTSSTHS